MELSHVILPYHMVRDGHLGLNFPLGGIVGLSYHTIWYNGSYGMDTRD